MIKKQIQSDIPLLYSIIGFLAAILLSIVAWWALRVETAITDINTIKVDIVEIKTAILYSPKKEIEDWLREKNNGN